MRVDIAVAPYPLPIVALFGPTGVGKTDVALALARLLRARRGEDPVAVSADALQVYEGLGVLTGAADATARAELEHRLIGHVPVTGTYDVASFAAHAHAEIDAAVAAGRRPIVVGGTGLYLRAALTELELRPPPPPGVREGLTERMRAEGPEALHAQLPEEARAMAHPRDRHRIVRLHELLASGAPLRAEQTDELWTASTRVPTVLAGLVMDREVLYARIDARVEAMVAAGAREEVVTAARRGASQTARQALGFGELLAGDVDAMKRNTRRYAKRQLTWMRKLGGVHTIDVTSRGAGDVAEEILALLA